ncbi:DEAD/DEAH box helicase, partial [Nitrosopumilus sp.]|nr:DEAD/DEAH box helicase [Nitrosopumilus sp.]
PKSNMTVKLDSYYLNNREYFYNFINKLFSKFKKTADDAENKVSCSNIGKVGNFVLMEHQKIITDYMNQYTPYRGMLLYHGLGSGKTCTSIAISEGMKDDRQIITMTPASLQRNYRDELKKCGSQLFKRNQHWVWVPVRKIKNKIDDEHVEELAKQVPKEYITKKKGVWMTVEGETSNFKELSDTDKQQVENQLEILIEQKYKFVNYNGLSAYKLNAWTKDFTENPFDNKVIVIDEAHNLISRIVNKLNSSKPIKRLPNGKLEHMPTQLSLKLYELLCDASNAKIILLSGTPIINYPNEFAILFNILRGYINTFEIPIHPSTRKMTTDKFKEILKNNNYNYINYARNNVLSITQNPYGFVNSSDNSLNTYNGVVYNNNDNGLGIQSHEQFKASILKQLANNNIHVEIPKIKLIKYKALPDKLDTFISTYINMNDKSLTNKTKIQKRIMGLSSYFRSAQEGLLAKYDNKNPMDLVVDLIPMSDFQFQLYYDIRLNELEISKNAAKQKKPSKATTGDGIYENKSSSSSYRIFSRIVCNYAVPSRPTPSDFKEDKGAKVDVEAAKTANLDEKLMAQINKEHMANEKNMDDDELMNNVGGDQYVAAMEETIENMVAHGDEYFSKKALEQYSPKFLRILNNIQNEDNVGCHLIYSQFRTLEGIGLFSEVLNYHGYKKIPLVRENNKWILDIDVNDTKPMYALYTGTESDEEKELIRNIYNGDWDILPSSISDTLIEISKARNVENDKNMYGDIIKVLMITASGSEGINLKNTRFVHITEYYWNNVRINQVIGRARRICSHSELPVELQTIRVFIYLMKFADEQVSDGKAQRLVPFDYTKMEMPKGKAKYLITSDQALYEIALIKDKITEQLINTIKETSIDCQIYDKNNKKEGIVCFNFNNPSKQEYSFVPNYELDSTYVNTVANNTIAKNIWNEPVRAIKRTVKDKSGKSKEITYAARELIPKEKYEIYDMDEYNAALLNPDIEPTMIATMEKDGTTNRLKMNFI